mmetsp:Transcript_67389/g.179972  ORF Transcript_67389/g.179972 Transcript_67389/m.179972 type:complete len:85 (+) Transcript_67389:242-496(+)
MKALDSLSKDEQIRILRTALEQKLGERGQVKVLRDTLRQSIAVENPSSRAGPKRFKGAWLSKELSPDVAVAKVLSARSARGSWQ